MDGALSFEVLRYRKCSNREENSLFQSCASEPKVILTNFPNLFAFCGQVNQFHIYVCAFNKETSRRLDDSSGSYITCVLVVVPTVVNIIDNQVRAELLLSRDTNN